MCKQRQPRIQTASYHRCKQYSFKILFYLKDTHNAQNVRKAEYKQKNLLTSRQKKNPEALFHTASAIYLMSVANVKVVIY